VTPLYLFSLPRSGSTLLQRLLAGHPSIATASEPWILLPLAGMVAGSGIRSYAEYSQRGACIAIEDLAARMPNGARDFEDAVRGFTLDVYRRAAGGETAYFLDKTPRYFLIIDFVLRVFPDAKAIVLLRNPLDVLSSVITTWGGDRLWLHNALLDLYRGPCAIHEALTQRPDRFLTVRYEHLVSDPEGICRRVCEHLGLEYDVRMLDGDAVAADSGRLGDKSANLSGSSVVQSSVNRWHEVLNTPVRRHFARRYLRRLGRETCATFGLDQAATLAELDRLKLRWDGVGADASALVLSFLGPLLASTTVRDLWRRRGTLPIPKID